MPISSKFKQKLKAQAHALKPVVLLGNQGLTEAVQAEIENALIAHELIKVKIPGEDRELRKTIADEICKTRQAELVQMIGSICVIYRKNSEE